MIRITSGKNPVVKEIRSLRSRRERYDRGLYFIEGARFVAEALNESGATGNAQAKGEMFSAGSVLGTGNKPDAGSMYGIMGNKPDAGSMPDIRYVVVSDSFAGGDGYETIIRPCLDRDIRVYSVADSLFESVSDTDNPQGVLAVLEKRIHEGCRAQGWHSGHP